MIESGNGKPRTHSIHDFPRQTRAAGKSSAPAPADSIEGGIAPCTITTATSTTKTISTITATAIPASSPRRSLCRISSPIRRKSPPPRWAKITAIILAGAIVSGACGYGGAMLANHASYGSTTITQSSRTASAVTVKKVDGQTAMSPAEVYASTVNSVVSINCSSTSTNIFGQSTESASSGSGFIITSDGYIVTNHHVISGASKISVTLHSGDTYDATVIGSDSDYDVAVLKVDAKDLTPVTLGDSTNVNVGDTVLAVGNPLGELTFSMSQGIVSCCDRAINVDGTPFNMIQVDASINPGNPAARC